MVVRIRVYIDGFNVYYGGKRLAKDAGTPNVSWRWLDYRALAASIAAERWGGRGAVIDHVTYCTARVAGPGKPRQFAYLRAMKLSGAVDWIEYGIFRERYKEYPAASEGEKGEPVIMGAGHRVGVSVREEKGSDVNIATHLLIDTLSGSMDGAIVISNDSDLALPIAEARKRIPVGTVCAADRIHGSLRPNGPGAGHWFHLLTLADLAAHQLPNPCCGIARPSRW